MPCSPSRSWTYRSDGNCSRSPGRSSPSRRRSRRCTSPPSTTPWTRTAPSGSSGRRSGRSAGGGPTCPPTELLARSEPVLVDGQSRLVLGGVDRAQRRAAGLHHGLNLGRGQLGAALLTAIANLLQRLLLEV